MPLTLEDVDRILDQAEPELLKRLKLDIGLTALLVKHGVITEALADVLDVPLLSKRDKVHRFLQDLRLGPIERFLNFCKVVYEDGRPHLLKDLDVDIEEIQTQLRSISAKPTPSPTQQVPESHGEGAHNENLFPHQRQYYQEILCKLPIYEYVMKSDFFQIDEIFTNLELMSNNVEKGPYGGFTTRAQPKSIELREVFEGIDSPFLRVILEGKPGSGKTSILKHCAIEWAKARMMSTDRKERRNCRKSDSTQGESGKPLSIIDKDLVIYVDKTNERHDLESTIKAALKGPKEEREKAFHFWQNHSENCFLLCDGIDEFLKEELVNEIFHLASQASCNILMSCRIGHPRLESQMKHFNRHVKVGGFDPENAQVFIQRFMRSLNSPVSNENESMVEEKTKALCSFLASDNVQAYYKNPLNCAFVCLLYDSGAVTEEELSSLKLVDLFRKQQEQLLKRECVKKAKTQKEAKELEKTAESSVEGIHRMALHSLLHNEKQSSFTEDDIQSFGVNISSPAMVLLHEEDQLEGKVYSWPHQVIKEFHAASAVQNETIMYMIASRPELNQLSKFLLSYLVDTDIEAARNILLAMMLMQSSDPPCTTSMSKESHQQSPFGHPCSQISNLRQFLSQQNINDLLKQPLVKFPMTEKSLRVEEIQQCLSNTDWALRNALTMIQLVDMTLDISSSEEHHEMLKSVIHPFLPSSYSGSLRQYDRICPWELDMDKGFAKNMVILGGYTDCLLHPVSGRVPLMLIQYADIGAVAFLVAKAMNHATSEMEILVGSPKAVTDSADILKTFAKGKRGKLGLISLFSKNTKWNWDFSHAGSDKDDSSEWKKAIMLVNDIFRPKWGVQTSPYYPELLTQQDQQELRDMGVKLVLNSYINV